MNAKPILFVGLLLTSSQCAQVLAGGPYRGPGGQLEAAGAIASSYMLTAQTIEECAKHPKLKTRAHRSLRDYLDRNQQSYMDVMRKLPALANANGGDVEVQRLKAELESTFTQMEVQSLQIAKSKSKSLTDCAYNLDTIDKGILDLKVNMNNELTRILQ